MIETSITKWIKKKIRRLIGIVEDGDTATHSIAAGKYVVWKGNLYKASTAIAIGTTLSTSNLTAVSDGGLNEIDRYQNLKWNNSDKTHIKVMNQVSGAKSAGDTATISFDSCPTGSTQLVGVLATSFGNNNPVRIACTVVTDKAFIAKFYDGLWATQTVEYIGFFV